MDDLKDVLRDASLTTIAFAIALGYALLQTAEGVAYFVEGVTAHSHDFGRFGLASLPQYGQSLTWVWGHRLFTFGQLVSGLIELGTILLVAAFVRRRSKTSD
jgi:hypothetical protein